MTFESKAQSLFIMPLKSRGKSSMHTKYQTLEGKQIVLVSTRELQLNLTSLRLQLKVFLPQLQLVLVLILGHWSLASTAPGINPSSCLRLITCCRFSTGCTESQCSLYQLVLGHSSCKCILASVSGL